MNDNVHLETSSTLFNSSFSNLSDRYAAMCSLGTQPAVVQTGTGGASREARLDAASATLEHLRTIVFGPYAAGVLQSVDPPESVAIADE